MNEPDRSASDDKDAIIEALFAKAPIGIYIARNGKFQFTNTQFEHDLGYGSGELLGTDSLQPVVPDDRRMVRENSVQMLKGDRTSPYEFRVLTKSGGLRWVLGAVVPITYRNTRSTLGFYMDVSAQVQSLRQREQELTNVYNTVSDVIFVLSVEKDGKYRFASVNPAFTTVTGIAPHQVVGKLVNEVIPEPSLTTVLGRYEEAIREKRAVRWEETSEYPTGRLVGDVSVAPVFDDGNCIYLVGAVHDVTERKRSEEALRVSEERYRVTLDRMLEGCQIIDFGWRYIYLNDVAVGHSHQSRDELLGHTMMEVYPGIETTEMFANLSRCMEERTHRRMENLFTFPDGSQGWFELSIEPVPEGIFILSLDITERKRAEEALLESNRLLEEAMAQMKVAERRIIQQQRLEALGQMASGIAHDFNNALTPILGFSQMLLTDPEALQDTEAAQRYLGMINLAAKDAATVVGRLRDFYRTREASEAFAPVSLAEIVGQAISFTQARWKDQAQANGITIDIETSLQEVPPVMGNQAELRQALANLILNAVDAMPKGGKITLSTLREEGHSVLSVGDTGTGMTEEVRRRCLEPFFTTKGEGGSGMGLPAVYGTVQRHGGTLEIETEVGKGSTFTIRLPITMPQSTEVALTEPVVKSLHVFVVDDQPMVRELISEFLKADGHTVEAATNGKDALEKFVAGRFDLVVTDRAMPGMSGDQLAVAIKKADPSMPVILLTGIGGIMQDAKERPQGINVVLSKPPSLTELRRAISSCMTSGSGDQP